MDRAAAPGPGEAERAARALLRAERERCPVAPLADVHPGLTVARAYAVQLAGRRLRLGDGRRLVGRKVALTSAAAQAAFGAHEPVVGHLLDDMLLADGATVAHARFVAPRAAAIGAWVPLGRAGDLAALELTMRVGDRVAGGPGAAVLGHPAEAVAWAARALAVHGEGIGAGEVVLPGSVAAALPLRAGDVVEATAPGVGAVRATLA